MKPTIKLSTTNPTVSRRCSLRPPANPTKKPTGNGDGNNNNSNGNGGGNGTANEGNRNGNGKGKGNSKAYLSSAAGSGNGDNAIGGSLRGSRMLASATAAAK